MQASRDDVRRPSPKSTASESFFQAITHFSPLATLVTNALAEITYVNPSWEQQFGYCSAEVIGRNPKILQSGKTPPVIYRNMWTALNAGESFQTTDVIDRRKDGSFFNLWSTFFPVEFESQLNYVQILDDITETMSTAEFHKQFIRVAAHDIRSPLHNLKIIAELAAQERHDKTTDELKKEIERLDKLTKSLLDVGQIEAGHITLNQTRFDIAALARSLSRARYAYSGTVGVSDVREIWVFGDEARIEQVLHNLVENALKYSASAAPIRIDIECDNSVAHISVSDTGKGIPHNEQEKLFDAYFRTHESRTSGIVGTGLGLFIVREIVRAHGSDMRIESEMGKGTTFSFDLPLARI